MGMVTWVMKRRLEEAIELIDHISPLPDAILGETVSLLHTKEGGHTQVLSSWWSYIWRSVPLNIDLINWHIIPMRDISCILSLYPGLGRRFSVLEFELDDNNDNPIVILDDWLQSLALTTSKSTSSTAAVSMRQSHNHRCHCLCTASRPPSTSPASRAMMDSQVETTRTSSNCRFSSN
jgi:hypothetical protein